ncbi:MAG: response regulator transcription factor [Dehalococcoidia bacterium]|nr:response regulator transcription factor [Dehalococcoidia bacterium]
MDNRITVLLADDQRLFREGLRTLLELHQDINVVGEASDGIEAEAMVAELRPQVVLMDLRMPRRDGIEATRRIIAERLGAQVLVLTTYDDDDLVFRSIDAGAAGYLLKDVGSDALANAVRAAARGDSPLEPRIARKVIGRLRTDPASMAGQVAAPVENAGLTSREVEVLQLLGAGSTNREIAQALSLTEGTVKNYISSILTKTGMRDRTQVALLAVRQGLVKHQL